MYTTETIDNYLIIKYSSNRLDHNQPNDFIKKICEQININHKVIIFDLSKVEFMDSSGLGTLLALLKSLQTKTKLLFCGAGDNIKNQLKLTNLDKILNIYKDLNSAIRASDIEYQNI